MVPRMRCSHIDVVMLQRGTRMGSILTLMACENPSFEQAFARVENNFPEGWYCAHDINADFVPPTR